MSLVASCLTLALLGAAPAPPPPDGTLLSGSRGRAGAGEDLLSCPCRLFPYGCCTDPSARTVECPDPRRPPAGWTRLTPSCVGPLSTLRGCFSLQGNVAWA